MYVAGNAGALAWRVNISSVTWTKMWDRPDVTDGSLPHGDCRNYAWEASNSGKSDDDRLVLVSDGGIFARNLPRKAGGTWVSLNGDVGAMELLSANYAPREGQFVAGAQDNSAQVTPKHARPGDVAVGFVEGDGTGTCVDNVANPARLFGTTQFLGIGAIENDPTDGNDGDDDDDCGGLCFAQGGDDTFIGVPLEKYFPAPSAFPFFVTPYVLNSQDTTKLVFWANGTSESSGKDYSQSGFYAFNIPHDGSVKSKDDIGPPSVVAYTPNSLTTEVVLDFVAGGFTKGKSDPSLLVAVTTSQLLVRSASTGDKLMARKLPTTFAEPVGLAFDPSTGERILGPLTHGRTMSVSVSPSDSDVIGITGWATVDSNEGPEDVFVTMDGGETWQNITANLREASGVVGKVRPGGLLIVDLLENKGRAVLVGCSNGVLVAYLDNDMQQEQVQAVQWSRFGSEREFPIVLTADLSYEHYSDTLVAATFGRGIYVIYNNTKEALLDHRYTLGGSTVMQPRVPEKSSAVFFPPQM